MTSLATSVLLALPLAVVAASDRPLSDGGRSSSSAEDDAKFDKTDANLTRIERRVRMQVCMELVKHYATRNELEVRLFVKQLADRLSEHDAKNYLFHSLLVNCYHTIRQAEEVHTYGSEEIAAERLHEILQSPEQRPRLRLSASQLEVLNELLREEGAMGHEVEILGMRLSDLSSDRRLAVGAVAALTCAGLIGYCARRLLQSADPRSSRDSGNGSRAAKAQRKLQRAQDKASGGELRRRR
eukprot:TRINITY_DN22110_c0_g1_i1.p1 TRINITY_DN22110_c0_g1~~TRINITY_DN22110_c0_g1_i1.p1  ORF type:complete len:241 (-),score=48.92 TRINITY_DN22110_c0_g1_i1:80-802(-)